jgi:cytochrome c-type biogenesis protein CcmH
MMGRWRGWVAIGWMLAICVLLLITYGHPASHPTLDDRTRALAAELRCPICHGESVADSTTDIARSIRALIRKRLSEGQSPDTIKRYLVSRYGDSIMLAPPAAGLGMVAWLAPLLLLVGGLGLLAALVAAWRSRGEVPAMARSEYLERARAELAAGAGGDVEARAKVQW